MEKLGIEPSLLLAQIINFSIIVVVLTKFLYKPILAMLAKRKKEIEEGLLITERLRLEEEKLGARREKLLNEARKEARVILEDAKMQGKDLEKEIVAAAHKEADHSDPPGSAGSWVSPRDPVRVSTLKSCPQTMQVTQNTTTSPKGARCLGPSLPAQSTDPPHAPQS